MKNKLLYNIIPIILFIIAFMSINSWSLWVDEASTAFLAASNSLADLKFNLFKFGSETQMPGWVLFIWGWSKLFGISEYALRFSNLFFIAILLVYYYYIQIRTEIDKKDKKILTIAIILSIINPFILYNLNEARSNISVFCISFITIYSFMSYLKYNNRKDWILFCLGIISAFTINMLCGFLIPIFVFILIQQKNSIFILFKKHSISIIFTFLVLSVMLIYYLYTLSINKGGAKETPGLGNIGYVIYDFLGFGGIGPDKNTLRESDNKVGLLMQYIPQFVTILMIYLSILVLIIKNRNKYNLEKIYLKSFLFGITFFIIVAYFISFRFWSRHLLFIYPIVILLVSEVFYSFFNNDSKIIKIMPLCFLVIFIISSYNIVFKDKYKKENISFAIDKSQQLRYPNEKIIFTGGYTLAWYYRLDNYTTEYNHLDNEKGLLVWFRRNSAYGNDDRLIKDLLESSNSLLLYQNKDCIIIRLQ